MITIVVLNLCGQERSSRYASACAFGLCVITRVALPTPGHNGICTPSQKLQTLQSYLNEGICDLPCALFIFHSRFELFQIFLAD